jgi:hypothetical protein
VTGARASAVTALGLSPREIYFFWHFLSERIMVPDTRKQLRRAWGMCARHSVGFAVVEASFRHGRLQDAGILYEDVMARAAAAFTRRGPMDKMRLGLRLRGQAPCLMCNRGYGAASKGPVPEDIVAQGRDTTEIVAFAVPVAQHWRPAVCGRCASTAARARCRIHFRAELAEGRAGVPAQRALGARIAKRVTDYSHSVRWDSRHRDTPQARAAVISAIGWCSGWTAWFGLLPSAEMPPDHA